MKIGPAAEVPKKQVIESVAFEIGDDGRRRSAIKIDPKDMTAGELLATFDEVVTLLRMLPGEMRDRRQLFLHSNDNYSCRAGAGLMERHGDQRAFRIGLGKAVA